MLSKSPVVFAAGLLSGVFAQNATVGSTYGNSTVAAQSTVTLNVYASTTTVFPQCSVCTPGATGGQYTVVVSGGVTTTLGGGAGVAATNTAVPSMALDGSGSSNGGSASSASASNCGFQLAVNGTNILQQISDGQIQAQQAPAGVGQIGDGQVQVGSGLTPSSFTISNGMVYDQIGRICSISGQNQSQFQCNYVPTDGSTTTTFSIVNMNLAFNGDTSFYQCLLGADGEGYNIYKYLTGNQHTCTPIVLTAIGATNCAPATPSTTLVPSMASVPAAATTTAATVVFTGSASTQRGSLYALAAAFSLLLLI